MLILGGTTETHKFIEKTALKDNYIISVATTYGFHLYKQLYGERVIKIRFDKASLKDFINTYAITHIVDTTHPYAEEITNIAKACAKEMHINYVFAKRDSISTDDLKGILTYDRAYIFNTYNEIISFLESKNYNNILFTIGVKNIDYFKNFLNKSYVRILPDIASIQKCLDLGLEQRRIIAMQGPFSTDLNCALIDAFNIDCLVSKCSGKSGGFYEKSKAAQIKQIDLVLIHSPG